MTSAADGEGDIVFGTILDGDGNFLRVRWLYYSALIPLVTVWMDMVEKAYCIFYTSSTPSLKAFAVTLIPR